MLAHFSPKCFDDNNRSTAHVQIITKQRKILLIDSRPRWEFRYLRNTFDRDQRWSLRSVLVGQSTEDLTMPRGDRGNTFPDDVEDLKEFDLIVLGDLRAELFSEEQLEQIREHVAVRGGGLLWIAGPGATPGTWRGSPTSPASPW